MKTLSENDVFLVSGGTISAADAANAESDGEEVGKALVKIAVGIVTLAGLYAIIA
ncbi:MAG TPA: hypothetical protein VJL61_02625 [Rhodanobacteraceae bacterium]|nr:hypothetical protein [Rhodanobacteraceae bacterium]